nr:hypothetical protein [uncultured Flavobacterium sp.]
MLSGYTLRCGGLLLSFTQGSISKTTKYNNNNKNYTTAPASGYATNFGNLILKLIFDIQIEIEIQKLRILATKLDEYT